MKRHTDGFDSATPGTDSYGKHMTSEEVIEFFAPAQSTADAVLGWLIESGLSADRLEVSVNKQVDSIAAHHIQIILMRCSGFNSMQQLLKPMIFSSRTSMFGNMFPERLMCLRNLTTFLMIFTNTLIMLPLAQDFDNETSSRKVTLCFGSVSCRQSHHLSPNCLPSL